jgi:hypothetical protein
VSDPHDEEPIDQATIDCWRSNYGLDKRSPAEAARWWADNMQGKAPAGAVAALGILLNERASAIAAAVAAERERCAQIASSMEDTACDEVASRIRQAPAG